MAYHQPLGCISSRATMSPLYLITPLGVYKEAFAMMIYKTSFWWYVIPMELMIYNASHWLLCAVRSCPSVKRIDFLGLLIYNEFEVLIWVKLNLLKIKLKTLSWKR